MDRSPGRSAARQAGVLFGAAGLLTILNNFVPGSGYLDKVFLHVVGLVCLALGAVVAFVIPWERWPARATLVLAPVAFAVIAVANDRGGVSTYSYAPFFVTTFMWVGLHHPPRTSLLLSPLAALAYMVPGLLAQEPPDGALSSVTVAIPVAVLIGETIARAVGRLRRTEERAHRGYDLLLRSQALAHVGSWEWNPATGAVEWSPEMYRILGIDPEGCEAAFATVLALVVPEDQAAVTARFRAAMRGETVEGFAFRITRRSGEQRWLWVEGGPAAGLADGTVTGFVQDITETKAVEEELQRLALHDDLTGLANRRGFVTVGQQLLRVAQRSGQSAVLAYIDLDEMKTVNDRHGHAAGDAALLEVAQLLRTTFRESDLLGRIGGDEFCVLIPRDAYEGKAALGRLREAVENRVDAFPPVSLSIGVAEYSGSGPASIEQLIDEADTAMYGEKAARRRAGVS